MQTNQEIMKITILSLFLTVRIDKVCGHSTLILILKNWEQKRRVYGVTFGEMSGHLISYMYGRPYERTGLWRGTGEKERTTTLFYIVKLSMKQLSKQTKIKLRDHNENYRNSVYTTL